MNVRTTKPRTTLYTTNIQMLLLCGLTSFYVLVSPLVPYTFDTATIAGSALFVVLQLLLTTGLGAVGLTLNQMAAEEVRVTPDAIRLAFRRGLRR